MLARIHLIKQTFQSGLIRPNMFSATTYRSQLKTPRWICHLYQESKYIGQWNLIRLMVFRKFLMV